MYFKKIEKKEEILKFLIKKSVPIRLSFGKGGFSSNLERMANNVEVVQLADRGFYYYKGCLIDTNPIEKIVIYSSSLSRNTKVKKELESDDLWRGN